MRQTNNHLTLGMTWITSNNSQLEGKMTLRIGSTGEEIEVGEISPTPATAICLVVRIRDQDLGLDGVAHPISQEELKMLLITIIVPHWPLVRNSEMRIQPLVLTLIESFYILSVTIDGMPIWTGKALTQEWAVAISSKNQAQVTKSTILMLVSKLKSLEKILVELNLKQERVN